MPTKRFPYCSKCGHLKAPSRRQQATCHKCHAAYARRWRADHPHAFTRAHREKDPARNMSLVKHSDDLDSTER